LSPDKCHKVHQLRTTDALCSSSAAELLVTALKMSCVIIMLQSDTGSYMCRL